MFQNRQLAFIRSKQTGKAVRSTQARRITIIVLAVLVWISFLLSSCSLFNKEIPVEVLETNPNHHNLTLNELTAEVSLIIQGKVISSESWVDDETVYR